MHDVGGGVSARGGLAPIFVDLRMRFLAEMDFPGLHGSQMQCGMWSRGLRVRDSDDAGFGADRAPVPDLTARLRVERGDDEEQANQLPLLGRRDFAELL